MGPPTRGWYDDVIGDVMNDYGVDPSELEKKDRFRDARGYGFFQCTKCSNRWSSNVIWMTIDLGRQRIARRWQQKCKKCSSTCISIVTPVELEDMIDYLCRRLLRIQSDRPRKVGKMKKPHASELCEKCQFGKTTCWDKSGGKKGKPKRPPPPTENELTVAIKTGKVKPVEKVVISIGQGQGDGPNNEPAAAKKKKNWQRKNANKKKIPDEESGEKPGDSGSQNPSDIDNEKIVNAPPATKKKNKKRKVKKPKESTETTTTIEGTETKSSDNVGAAITGQESSNPQSNALKKKKGRRNRKSKKKNDDNTVPQQDQAADSGISNETSSAESVTQPDVNTADTQRYEENLLSEALNKLTIEVDNYDTNTSISN